MRFVLLVLVYMVIVDCVERCSHPQAEDGHQISEGCLLRTCKAGVWRTSLVGNLCCYERKAFTINTTISSTMSRDGCVKADIDCVEEILGQAKMILSIKNYCEEYATEEQMEEIKELLIRQKEGGAGYQEWDEKNIPKGLSLSETITPSEITIKQSSQATTIGSSLDVTCEVSGVTSRDYTIKWSKAGHADLDINVNSRGGALRFDGLTIENEGLYRCMVTTSTGPSPYKDFYLSVQGSE